jgi:PEP-CTERM motif
MTRQPTRLIAILAIVASIAWHSRSADASSITGTVTPVSGATYNLTTLGSLDWVHYGLLGGGDSNDGEPVRDSSGSIIGALSSNVNIKAYTGGINTYEWSNGTPVVSGSNTNGTYLNDGGGVLSLTLAASTTPLQAEFFVGTSTSISTSFTVALNDGSGASYTATNLISGADIITIDYVANSASTLTMTFGSSALDGGPNAIGLDAVTISPGIASVPEPSSCILLGLGVVGFLAFRRRRSHSLRLS